MNPIDIHTHVFNLRYLPLSGIIRRYTHGKVPLKISRGVAKFFLSHTAASFETEQNVPTAGKIRIPIVELLGKPPQEITVQQKAIDSRYSLFNMGPDEIIEGLTDQITPSDLQDREIREALLSFSPESEKVKMAFSSAGLMGDLPDTLIFDGGILSFGHTALKEMLEWVISKMDMIENHLRWLVFMMNSEEDIFLRLKERDGYGVSKFVHLMMDVDHYFKEQNGEEHKSYYDFTTQQIPNMLKLQNRYPDLIGFVAVDPAKPNWKEILDIAISSGFKGIKIYPPLGYHFDMEADEVLRVRIDEILAYCVQNDLPLFTHCNNSGFEAYPGEDHSGYNSNPKYWSNALIRYPNLRLCLGHAGGGSGWFSQHLPVDITHAAEIDVNWVKDTTSEQKNWNQSYAAQVLRLCVLYENVYCDASYLDEMVDSSGELSIKASENFRERLLSSIKDNPCFERKIMYGSDWHMLFREAKQEVYYKSYVDFMSHPDLLYFKEDFFEGNARKYLKM